MGGKREALIKHLSSNGIDVGIHFVPVHKHTAFRNARCGNLSVAERVVDEVLTLPLHSNMKPEFADRIMEGVTSFFA